VTDRRRAALRLITLRLTFRLAAISTRLAPIGRGEPLLDEELLLACRKYERVRAISAGLFLINEFRQRTFSFISVASSRRG